MNYFIRYAKPKYKGDLYDIYCKTGMLALDLPLSEEGLNDIENFNLPIYPKKIFYAPSNICFETATELKKRKFSLAKTIQCDYLKNIKHDFSKYITKDRFLNGSGIENVRIRFLMDLESDLLLESKQIILQRLNLLSNLVKNEENSLFITHGLFLVACSLYLNGNKDLKGITKLVDTNTPFFGSLLGFSVN